MSADNGIYILQSPVYREDEGLLGYQYRVIHAQSIENINYQPDKEGFNTQYLIDYFDDAQIYFNEADALEEANRMAEECPILEYGISFIHLPFEYPN